MRRNTSHGTGALPGTTVMRWSDPKNADKTAWMLANAGKQHSIPEVIGLFEREFGIRLNKSQVSLFRSAHGMQSRRNCEGRKDREVPVGTERIAKGYTVVKVRERPTVPMSKDNWVQKQRWVYEQHHGPIPPRTNILFGDGDTSNFDPDNLVAVPKSRMRRLNSGLYEWRNADELRAVLALEMLEGETARLEAARPRKCQVCGREFVPDAYMQNGSVFKGCAVNKKTCRSCLGKGLKARGEPKRTVRKKCIVCGREFDAPKKNRKRCGECVAEKPELGAEQHAAQRRRKDHR